ncbi:MAG: Na+/H+ antiporter NhaC [Candidatus Symbiothrix sp.]|jgi:NhaC family Na+:H+ antiporter|nr:Na+/H+ antiporter NhaC [Candidatus Symbiothrix sp.]
MNNTMPPSFLQAITPVIVLVVLLFINMLHFDDALGGANQTALIIAATVCCLIGWSNKVKWQDIQQHINRMILSAMGAILILFLIGALSGAWMISGIIPMMIYYGIELMHPSFLLVASVLICSVVSLATGSSWSTVATMGVAIIGVGNAFGLNTGLVAGAIISGAYFGDKMSPLSDTTNLAPAIAGTDLFTHIRYMIYTTGPAWLVTLVIFGVIGLFQSGNVTENEMAFIRQGIASHFNTSPFLLLTPLILIAIIVRKTPAIPAMLAGTVLGILSALLFQSQLLDHFITAEGFSGKYQVLMQSVFGTMHMHTGVPEVDDLLATNGMTGMLSTVFLILSAMIFGGAMDACGFLNRITSALISRIHSRTSLIGSTLLTCILFNITACDQYLSIVVPGKMLQKLYAEKGYKPEVLSRALEDSGTVTSVLVPWNSCGATQAKVLGVETLAYLPYCFFNLLSPLVNLTLTALNFKIRKIINSNTSIQI